MRPGPQSSPDPAEVGRVAEAMYNSGPIYRSTDAWARTGEGSAARAEYRHLASWHLAELARARETDADVIDALRAQAEAQADMWREVQADALRATERADRAEADLARVTKERDEAKSLAIHAAKQAVDTHAGWLKTHHEKVAFERDAARREGWTAGAGVERADFVKGAERAIRSVLDSDQSMSAKWGAEWVRHQIRERKAAPVPPYVAPAGEVKS